MDYKYINGVFLSRFQPIHNGHLYIIEKMAKECKNVLVIIGSSNEFGTDRNPYPLSLRYNMVSVAIHDCIIDKIEDVGLEDRIEVIELPDIFLFGYTDNNEEQILDGDFEWGKYLYYNIVGNIGIPVFSLYHGEKTSNAINNWFKDGLQNRIIFNSVNSGLDVSGTKVREAIRNHDMEYVANNCPAIVGKCLMRDYYDDKYYI